MRLKSLIPCKNLKKLAYYSRVDKAKFFDEVLTEDLTAAPKSFQFDLDKSKVPSAEVSSIFLMIQKVFFIRNLNMQKH